jgi:hypothetical protein
VEEAFVIVQIGDPELAHIFDEVFSPAIATCGLEPRRIDQDNEGGRACCTIRSTCHPVAQQTPPRRHLRQGVRGGRRWS